ncbi:hypothetical protein, partial [Desulfobulbus sp.]|uniref:hypothetical protein n=1 Tax=Desulfobulbus sp. TaxID=895 RepID=UPI0027BAC8EB
MTHPVGISSPKPNSNKKRYVISKSKIIAFKRPGNISEDRLTGLPKELTGRSWGVFVESRLFKSAEYLRSICGVGGGFQGGRSSTGLSVNCGPLA